MQGLPKHTREPAEILGVAEHASLEDLREAYAMAKTLARAGNAIERLEQAERAPAGLSEVEWAYKELVARFLVGKDNDEDSALPAVLLPGLTPDALTEPAAQSNVLLFSSPTSKKETEAQKSVFSAKEEDEDDTVLPFDGLESPVLATSAPVSNDDGIPELREALARAAAPFSRKQATPQTQNRGQAGRRLPEARTALPTNAPRPARTVRTVIGGEEREVVNIVARSSHREDVQRIVQGLLTGAEVLGGPLLRSLRQAMGVEESEICARIRLAQPQLVALEEDAFDKLPAPVYYRGFVISYLKYLGLERPDLADALTENYRAQIRARYFRGPR